MPPDTPAALTEAPPHAQRLLWLLTALSALAFMDRQIVAVLVTPIQAEFGFSDLQVGAVTGLGYAITFALAGLPLSRLADRTGRHRLIVASTRGLGGCVSSLGALATGFWGLVWTRGGSAISDAGGAPASMAWLAELFPAQQRSRVMGIFGIGGALGSLLAVLVGSWLAQRYGWRVTVALIGAGSMALALLLASLPVPRRAAQCGASAAPTLRPHSGMPASHSPRASASAAAVWRLPVARALIMGGGFALLAGYAFGTWNLTLLVRRHGLSLQTAGAVSAAAAAASVLAGLWAGQLTDRLVQRDPRWQLGVPLIGVGVALPCAWAYLALPAGALTAAVILVMGFAFSVACWAAPTFAALSWVVPAGQRATANALVMLGGAVFAAGLGPILTGALSDSFGAWLAQNGAAGAGGRGVAGDGLRYALACMVGLGLPAMACFAWALPRYPGARLALPHSGP